MPRKSYPLFTIGYEQATPAAVMRELKDAKIDILVDTRAVAASRKPGFSKRQLAAGLDEAGIAYVHLQKLGTPSEGRQAARAGDTKTLWRIYDKYITQPEPQAELRRQPRRARAGESYRPDSAAVLTGNAARLRGGAPGGS